MMKNELTQEETKALYVILVNIKNNNQQAIKDCCDQLDYLWQHYQDNSKYDSIRKQTNQRKERLQNENNIIESIINKIYYAI